MIVAFAKCHRIDDRHDAINFVLVNLDVLELFQDANLGHHTQERFQRTQLTNLLELIAEVLEGEIVLDELSLHLHGLLLVDGFFGLLDEAEDVAHAEDPVGRAVGIERFQRVELLAHAHEFKGLTGDVADRNCAAAAGVAVHLGQDYAGDAEALVEFIGGFDGILSGHGVGHEQNLHRVELFLELLQLHHQVVIDMEAAGRVHQQNVASPIDAFPACRACQVQRRRLSGRAFIDGLADIAGDYL